jgi:hypothetical protein
MVLLEAFSLIIYGMLIEKPAPSCMHLNVLTHLIRVSRNCRALGVVWTSPLVAALGSSLTIPLAMIEDVLIHGQHYSVFYILGSTQALDSEFVLLYPRVVKSLYCIHPQPKKGFHKGLKSL